MEKGTQIGGYGVRKHEQSKNYTRKLGLLGLVAAVGIAGAVVWTKYPPYEIFGEQPRLYGQFSFNPNIGMRGKFCLTFRGNSYRLEELVAGPSDGIKSLSIRGAKTYGGEVNKDMIDATNLANDPRVRKNLHELQRGSQIEIYSPSASKSLGEGYTVFVAIKGYC